MGYMEATARSREPEASLESSTESEPAKYLVTLKLPDEPACGRSEVVEQNLALGVRFRERFFVLVRENELEEGVRFVGEPMNLPFITIKATSKVAEFVRDMPEVASIFEDSAMFKHNA